jgi:Trypsin
VVAVNVTGIGLCSGVAIAPQYILTAAHCLDSNNNGAADVLASSVSVKFNGTSTTTIVADALTLNPNFTGFQAPSLNDDLALIHLSSAMPAAVPKYTIMPASVYNPVNNKFRIEMVGYGKSGDGDVGDTVAAVDNIKRKGANLVEAGNNNEDTGPGQTVVPELFRFDFEPATAPLTSEQPPHLGAGDNYDWYVGDSTRNSISYITTGESRSLGNGVESLNRPGDSGGPAFVKDAAGKLFLAGIMTFNLDVVSRGGVNGEYGTIGGGQWLGGYETWIESTAGVTYADVGSGSGQFLVPEPREYALAAGGVLGAWALARRRRHSRRAANSPTP